MSKNRELPIKYTFSSTNNKLYVSVAIRESKLRLCVSC